MTDEELHSQAAKLEKLIQNFRIVNPEGAVKSGFGKLKLGATDLEERVSNIEKSVAKFTLGGDDHVKVTGSFASGFAINAKPGVVDSGSGGDTPTPVPGCTNPAADNYDPFATVDDGSCVFTGACCDDGVCSVTTNADCTGFYLGDGTNCDSNLCNLAHFNIAGVTSCCMNSGGFSYDIAVILDGDFGDDLMTGPDEWFFSGLTTGQQYTGLDCDPDNFVGSFDIDTHFELSKSGSVWTFSWYFIIDGVHFPIFDATSTTMDFVNTIADCGGGSNGAFGGLVTSFSFT